MPGHEEEAAVLADAYIDALLRRPRPLAAAEASIADASPTKRAAVLLSALPRYHPSFAFEESLAARLREMAEGTAATGGRLAEVIPFPGAGRQVGAHVPAIDRRLLVGGAAIASGVSVAAVIAWWQVGRRQRQEVVA
jgi:hypothetical protein